MIEDTDWAQASGWGIRGHPAVVLVDEHGRIAGGFYGEGNAASWDELLAAL